MCWRILKIAETDETVIYAYDPTSIGELTGEFEVVKNSNIYYINTIANGDTEKSLKVSSADCFINSFLKVNIPINILMGAVDLRII